MLCTFHPSQYWNSWIWSISTWHMSNPTCSLAGTFFEIHLFILLFSQLACSVLLLLGHITIWLVALYACTDSFWTSWTSHCLICFCTQQFILLGCRSVVHDQREYFLFPCLRWGCEFSYMKEFGSLRWIPGSNVLYKDKRAQWIALSIMLERT
jgi:hypothetical protein